MPLLAQCNVVTASAIYRSSNAPSFIAAAAPAIPRNDIYRHENNQANGRRIADSPEDHTARALQALRVDPLDHLAVRQLGMLDIKSSLSAAKIKLKLAENITRRDLLTQLVLADGQARVGNYRDSLRHYDRMLVIYPQVRGVVLPMVAAASNQPAILQELVAYEHRNWFWELLSGPARKKLQMPTVASLWNLLNQAQHKGGLTNGKSKLLGALIDAHAFDEVASIARKDASVGQDAFTLGFRLSDPKTPTTPFVWKLSGGEAQTRITQDGLLEFEVPAGRRMLLASKMTALGSGTYDLSLEELTDLARSSGEIHLELRCLSAKPNNMPKYSAYLAARQAVHRPMTILSECVLQYWQVVADAGLGIRPFSGRVRLKLNRAEDK